MKLTDHVILFTAEGFGLGRIKPAPGTWGSLWGIPIGWALGYFDTTWWMRLLVGVAMFVVGVPICAKGAKLRNTKDPGSVVWDEIAAFPVVFAFVPVRPGTLLAGFVLFRFFDITKPFPVRQAENLGTGLGIMIDDTIAAVWATAVLLVLVDGLQVL